MSHRTLNADTPVEVANEIRKALKYIDIENLVVTSDCGFGRQGANRLIAFYKTAATAQGANIIRREHGLPETYVPCADPHLSQDLVPAASRSDADVRLLDLPATRLTSFLRQLRLAFPAAFCDLADMIAAALPSRESVSFRDKALMSPRVSPSTIMSGVFRAD